MPMRAVQPIRKSTAMKLSLRGLVKYMTSSPSAQRKVLRDFKYPDPEGSAQRDYYKEARESIVKYHKDGHDPRWLEQRGRLLTAQSEVERGPRKVRLRNNSRAIYAYARFFGHEDFEVLKPPTLSLSFASVRVSVFPDLYVIENNKNTFIKMNFTAQTATKDEVKIVCQSMFEAAEQAGLGPTSSHILYYDLKTGEKHKGARMGALMRRNIEASCQAIAAIWPTL